MQENDWTGFTPLHFAVLSQDDDKNNKIKALLDHGASPAARTPQGDTPLHLALAWAIQMEDVGECESIDDRLFLLDENPFGSQGLSHCHIACMFGKLEIVRSFLGRGLDPNLHRIRDRGPPCTQGRVPCNHLWHDDTCLHIAMMDAGRSDVVRLLLERGADPNARNSVMYTPLHNGIFDTSGNATRVLLEHGADVDARNQFDMTPLHVQCICNDFLKHKVVKALLEAGADVNLVHRFGVSALQDVLRRRKLSVQFLMFEHVIRLQEAGFDITNENLKSLLKFQREEFDDILEYRNLCRSELKRMNGVRLDERTTLRDALRVRDPRKLQQLAVNENLERIIADEAALAVEKKAIKFPIYGYLLRLQHRRGARITEAVLALQKLYTCNAIADRALPQEYAEMVVSYLTCEDLWRVIQAASR